MRFRRNAHSIFLSGSEECSSGDHTVPGAVPASLSVGMAPPGVATSVCLLRKMRPLEMAVVLAHHWPILLMPGLHSRAAPRVSWES